MVLEDTSLIYQATLRYLFTYHLSYDGSFQLVRKNKAYDKWDTCLSEGRKYFVDRTDFSQHLALADATDYDDKVLFHPSG